MGAALTAAAVKAGHEVVVVSGPVKVEYDSSARVVHVVTTEEMFEAADAEFQKCDGMIGVAAPCDYRPVKVAQNKITKTGDPIALNLIETPDIVASLGAKKGQRWVVGFALETEDQHFRAITKLEKKSCDLMVLNGPEAIGKDESQVELINPSGVIVAALSGPKEQVAAEIFRVVDDRLIART